MIGTGKVQVKLSHIAVAALFAAGDLAGFQTDGAFDYSKIERAINSGDFAYAQPVLEARTASRPDDGHAQLLLGIVFAGKKDPEQAEKHFQAAAHDRPSDPAPHTDLGNLLAAQGRFDEATQQFKAALALDSRDVTSLTNLGSVQLAAKQYESGLHSFETALHLHPQDATAAMGALQANLRLHRFPAADVIAARLLQLPGVKGQAVEVIGAMQAEAGDNEGAVHSFEQGERLFPKSPEIQFNLALALHKSGDTRRAQEVLEQLRDRNDTAELENLLGSIYERGGGYLNAIQSFQKAAEMEPANESYRFDYAAELLAHLNFEAARLVAQPAVHDFPQSARLRVALGVALLGLYRSNEAQSLFLETARAFPDSELALMYVTLSPETTAIPIPEAETLLRSYLQRHPNGFMPLQLLGHLKLSNDDAESALPLLKASVRANPNYAPAHLDLGKSFLEMGMTREAVGQFLESVRLDPAQTEGWYRLTLAYRKSGQKQLAGEAELKFHEREAVTGKADLVQTFLYSTR